MNNFIDLIILLIIITKESSYRSVRENNCTGLTFCMSLSLLTSSASFPYFISLLAIVI